MWRSTEGSLINGTGVASLGRKSVPTILEQEAQLSSQLGDMLACPEKQEVLRQNERKTNLYEKGQELWLREPEREKLRVDVCWSKQMVIDIARRFNFKFAAS